MPKTDPNLQITGGMFNEAISRHWSCLVSPFQLWFRRPIDATCKHDTVTLNDLAVLRRRREARRSR